MRLVGHDLTVSQVCFSKDGCRLASCSSDATVRLWPVTSEAAGTASAVLSGHAKGVSDVCWHPGQEYLGTASDDLTAGVWSVETQQRVLELKGHTHYLYCCKFHQYGSVLVTGALDEAIRFWDVRSGHCVQALPAHSDPVTCLDLSRDGTLLASASTDGLCRLWEFSTGRLLRTLLDRNNAPVTAVQFSPNNHYLMESILGERAQLRMWDWRGENGAVVRRFTGHVNQAYCLPSFFLDNGNVMTPGEDGTLTMWSINSGKMSKHQMCPEEAANVHDNGSRGKDGTPGNPYSPQTLNAVHVHTNTNRVAFHRIGDPTHAITVTSLPGHD